jgi:hypothetical protein
MPLFATAVPLPPPPPPEVIFVHVPWHHELLFLVLRWLTLEMLIGFGLSAFGMLLFKFGLVAVLKSPLVALLYLYDCVRSFRNPFRGFIVWGKSVDEFEDALARKNTTYMADYNKKLARAADVNAVDDGGGDQSAAQPEDYSVGQQVPNAQLQQQQPAPQLQQQQPPPSGLYARTFGRR